ncbi:MAG: glycine--tRNA ligase [Pseudonocardiaceae bacterium]
MSADRIETVVSLCKRRGFVFPNGEIYGGTGSGWDYGPLGVELKENIKRQWWRTMVTGRDDVVGLDSSIILPRQVWVASGHVEAFVDPGLLTTHLGPVGAEWSMEGRHYLRPETAQGIFVNFQNVMMSSRKKPPFGIGQIGKSFRNEIVPGDFLFRTCEFEQMELEYFVEPGADEQWHQYWIDARVEWYVELGIDRDNLRLYEHPKEKLSHYSKRTVGVEYRFDFSTGRQWGEVEGIANRTDFDLRAHSNHSGVDLSSYDQASDSRYRAYVIGPAADVARSMMAFLLEAYTEDETSNAMGGVGRRVVLRLDRRLAPVKVAVLSLSRNADLTPKAREIAAVLRRSWNVDFDDAGAIGRRYRRQDEVGTPFCVTVDFESLSDHAVAVRERDTMSHERIAMDQLESYLGARLIGC